MSDIHARIPTLAAAQLEKHLHVAARDLDAEIPLPLPPMKTRQATAVVPAREAPPTSVTGAGSPLRAPDAERIGDFDPTLLAQAVGFGIPDDPSSPRPEAREDSLGGGYRERTADQGAADHAGVAPPGGESEPTPLARREGDRRTLIQREADMFTSLLIGQHKDRSAVGVKIGVMVPAETLTGESNAPGVSADRSWALPAEQARELARPRMDTDQIQHEWYTLIYNDSPPEQVPGHPSKLLDASQGRTLSTSTNGGVAAATDPGPDPLVPKNLLAITYQGHDPPAPLRDALMFRDGTCQAPGCTVPAERCDIDHQVPWMHPAARSGGGTTTASNLWHLCRRHHRMKSHGHLRPRPLTE